MGKVAVEDAVSTSWRAKHLRGASGNIFEVEWNPPVGEGGGHAEGPWFPVVDNGTCSTAGCEYVSDWGGNCLCGIQINNTVVFVETGLNTSLPSAAELRAALFIGASDPEQFGATGVGYTLCTSDWCTSQSDVAVYTLGTSAATPTALDSNTIFKLSDAPGRRSVAQFLRNQQSTVLVGSGLTQMSFRNPPNYNPNVGAFPRTQPYSSSLYELYG